MDANHRSPSGTPLIDGAILLLAMLLVVWVGVIVAASVSREGETGADAAGKAPPPRGTGETLAEGRRQAGWKLVWNDEFNEANCPSRAKWSFEHGFVRNGELQWYQPENAYCRDGVLVLEARREQKPNPNYRAGSDDWRLNRPVARYTSASITGKYSCTYGRAEALMRIDASPGSWTDFWALGTAYRRDPTAWPASGEVTIMEYYRNTVLANVCIPKRTECGWSSRRQSVADLGGQAWADRFHLWAMDWNARRIELFLDGKLVQRFAVEDAARRGRRSPYLNRPLFLLLSQALGGANGGDPTNAEFPVRLEADYVRIYQRAHRGARRGDL
jgi:beta-glucanase (GH16 family)